MTVPGVSQLADIRSGVDMWVWAQARAWEHFASRDEVLRELQFVLAVHCDRALGRPLVVSRSFVFLPPVRALLASSLRELRSVQGKVAALVVRRTHGSSTLPAGLRGLRGR